MTFEEIKKTISDGKKVFWKDKDYEVRLCLDGRYNVCHIKSGKYVGLSHLKEDDFFMEVK